MSDGMSDPRFSDISHPPKKPRLEISRSRRPYFLQVHRELVKHKACLSEALDQLNSDWASFCFVQILNCNADESCSFSRAYCKTIRNFQEEDASKRVVIWTPDLFDVALVQSFLDGTIESENQILDKQLTAFEKLAQFLDTISVSNTFLEEQLDNESLNEGRWAAVIGTHVLRKLAVSNEMKIDSGYSNLTQHLECPCGCKTTIAVGDNSMGHKEVWHGSVDILLGPVAVVATTNTTSKTRIEDDFLEESSSAFDLKRGTIKDARHQLIAESITFSFAMQSGVVPLVGISKDSFTVYMYDPEEDLLFESTNMPLFVEPMSVEGRQLNISSLIILWITVNFNQFFTGVESNQVEFGYTANLKRFIGPQQSDIYKHHLRIGGVRHVKSKSVEYNAGGNVGKFARL